METGFNVNYLLDGLSAIESDKGQIGLTDSNNSRLIDAPGTHALRRHADAVHRDGQAGAIGALRETVSSQVAAGDGRAVADPRFRCAVRSADRSQLTLRRGLARGPKELPESRHRRSTWNPRKLASSTQQLFVTNCRKYVTVTTAQWQIGAFADH